MNGAGVLPPLLEGVVSLLVVLGALVAALGSFGLLRLKTFYERVHPPTMGTTMGVALILIASMLMFSAIESRPIVHEILIALFAVVTTPVTYTLLLRAAVHRTDKTAPSAERNSTGEAGKTER